MALPSRVDVTSAAAELLLKLTKINGPLMFHQSGGCCDGSVPMCYLEGEFRTGGSDVLLARLTIGGIEKTNRLLDVCLTISILEAHTFNR